MKAVLSRVCGGPEALEIVEVAAPSPGPGQVVIAVHAAGVNAPDALVIADRYQIKPPRPFSPGGELAGVVTATGSAVRSLSVGDRVIAVPGWGAMAESVAIDERQCVVMPDAMPFDEAAVLLATYGTAYHALVERARLQPGERLLVLGAAGGVGSAAIELGKALGATVIAAASTRDKVDFALACGADRGVMYPPGEMSDGERRDLAAAFKSACDGGADVVCDPVGGQYAEPAIRTLNWQGRYLVVGFTAGIPRPPLNLVLLKSAAVLGVIFGAWIAHEPAAYRAQLDALLALYAAGRIRPRISARFPLEQAPDAIRLIGSRAAVGKIVITIRNA